MKKFLVACCLALFVLGQGACCLFGRDRQDLGYLSAPPIFLSDESDFPLTGMGIELPPKGHFIPAADISSVKSEEFRQTDIVVQPDLDVKLSWIRVGALYGIGHGWAADISIPYYRNRVSGQIGGEPASGIAEGLGDIALVAKRLLWSDDGGRKLVAAFGVELPTGKDDSVFGEDNNITNAYYANYPRRMSLAWQPGSGTYDGYLSLAYGQSYHRFSYVALLAAKLNSRGDEEVKLGNTFIAGASATYGIGRQLAGSLSLIYSSTGDDEYPLAPPPGVGNPQLAGTTEHGSTLSLEAGLRYLVTGRLVVGVSVKTPLVEPEDGLVPETQLSLMFYPSF